MAESAEPLQGAAALHALQRFLLGEWQGPTPVFGDRPLARLVTAVSALRTRAEWAPTPLDLAVLVRHVLRWCAESDRMKGAVPELIVPTAAGWPDERVWASVGVRADPRTQGLRVTAEPWCPDWLPDVPTSGVDGRAAGAAPRRPDLSIDADPFLVQALPGRKRYRSPGQRLAIRAALMTPPASTLLVVLPTGQGKSAVFQVIARYGFPDAASPGLVVVVTPTVSLALDHQETVKNLGFGNGPFVYQGGDDDGNAELLERVASGEQRLLFAAPEAITRGRLGSALRRAASDGLLSALVVDEAHLVEVWGKEFRPDFQILAGFRSSLLRRCRGTPFRTILLSATVTEQTVETLRTLFGRGPDGKPAFGVAAAVSLRPEIEYWGAQSVPREIRDQRVLEALHHVPRPAILYVTKVDDAKDWLGRCRSAGFGRVAMVTGDTPPDEREQIVRAWKRDQLDLVVGTSAFGLGIDKPDVRAVIHACIPESIDRFYQEVGRGGRDGCAALSLLLPADGDADTARSMQAKHIGIEKGFQRWQGMFLHRSRKPEVERGTHLVWVDAPPGGAADRMDFQGQRNVQWNLNTLTLMASARMIEMEELLHLPVDDEGHIIEGDVPQGARYEPFQRIRLVRGTAFLNEGEWEDAVDPVRKQSFKAQERRLGAMLGLVDSQTCWSERIGPVYDLGERNVRAARSCGGCPVCRKGKGRSPETPRLSAWPWPPAPVELELHRLVDPLNRLLVWYRSDEYPRDPMEWADWADWLSQALRRYRIQNVVLPEGVDIAQMLQERCFHWPLFVDHWPARGLPPGPSLVVMPPGAAPSKFLLQPRGPHEPRLVLVHEDMPDPEAPFARLKDRHNGRVLTLNQFRTEVER